MPQRRSFTPREVEVVDLIAQGFTNKQIADRLGVTVKTVEQYATRVFKLVGVKSRHELAAWRNAQKN